MSYSDELSALVGATRYLFGSIQSVRGADLSAPTPCPGWDLRRLLRHLCESLAEVADVLAAREFAAAREVRSGADPVAALRAAVVDVLLSSTLPPSAGRWCEVRGRYLPAGIVVGVAAVEMALHAWDIAQACRTDRPIPAELAATLLKFSSPLAEAGRAGQVFAKPVMAPASATPGDRLVALFGRQPDAP